MISLHGNVFSPTGAFSVATLNFTVTVKPSALRKLSVIYSPLDGCAVGYPDGTNEGRPVGPGVGAPVGVPVGEHDGPGVGKPVGEEVGRDVGNAEGDTVGAVVG